MAKGKKNSSDKKCDSERETRVLLEKIHSDVKTIAEGHSTIVNKLNEHDNRFNKIESEVETVKMAVMDTNQRVKSIEKKLDDHETHLSKVEEKVHA
ncbi:MAG: hypothetical protein A2Z72_01685 [Omnitrophica bacterium RBG_13_46_9]|nr:MAG: hypothetical protein A2Z72_01685 [Omnitrophica bacterium RBG_13_46_9]